ncbi:MAG: diguanylate cyclase [Desulfuromonadales bacterium]|nr:diguanylate cyclase [Desulfuromonadales bacterium]
MLEPSIGTKSFARCQLLVVEDQQTQLKSLEQLLHINGYTNVVPASGGDEAISILQHSTPQLILLDLQMPDTNGLDVIAFHHRAGLDSEIIVISGETSFPWVKEAMRMGVFDFICKPYKPEELLTTIVKALDQFQQKQKLQQEQKNISYMAYHDQLTNLPNRQLFNDRAHQVLVHAQRNERKFALLFMDMDGFKTINDRHGHLIGDRVLQLMATRILGCLRAEDTLSRYGGDEFALLLPDVADQHGVTTVAEKILSEIRTPFHINGYELHVRLSIGVAIYPSAGTDLDVLLHNADIAMYHVKTHRKNNYCFYSDDMSHNHKNTEATREPFFISLHHTGFPLSRE